MFCLFVLSAVLLSAAVEGRLIPCDRVPEHGYVSVSEGVYTFSCEQGSYTLLGANTARCVDGVFDVRRLPACARIVPKVRRRMKRFDDADSETSDDSGCPKGSVEKDSNCVVCPKGTYAPSEGEACVDCTIGTYQPAEAQTECLKCDEGTTTEQIGSDEKGDCVAMCTLPDKVYNGYFSVENTAVDPGSTVEFGKVVTLTCETGFRLDNSAVFNMDCETVDSTFNNECYRVEMISEKTIIYELQGGEATVTCRVEATHDIIGFHIVHDKTKFKVEEIAADERRKKRLVKRFDDADSETDTSTGCPAGSIESGDGTCATCPKGKYASPDGESCVECPIGTYGPSEALTECLKCDEGTTTEQTASIDKGDCVAIQEDTKDDSTEKKVTEQRFKISSVMPGGAVGSIRCMADVKADLFEQSQNELKVFFLDFSIRPESPITVMTGEALAITALVTYDGSLRTNPVWTRDGETISTFTKKEEPVTIDGSQFYASEFTPNAANFDDEGKYVVKINVLNLEGDTVLEKDVETEVTVIGFKIQPSNEDGKTNINESDDVKLTCSYKGLQEPQEIRWVDSSLKTFNEEWQTSTEEEGITTSILDIKEWPEDLPDDGKLMCAVFNGEDVVTKSEAVTLQTHGYEVLMGSDVKAVVGEKGKLECTASSPTELEQPPTVHWYKENTEGEDVFLSDGADYVTNNAQDGAVLKSILTIDDVDENDFGDYYCKATYTEPKFIEISAKDDPLLFSDKVCGDISGTTVENGKIVGENEDDGKVTFTVECNHGFWFSKGSGNLIYCDKDGNTIVPECEKVTIETKIVKFDDDFHLLEVSYKSKSWEGKGSLCDDGWGKSEADLVCQQNGFKHGAAVSLTIDEDNYALTEMNCPCGADETESCSATRYKDAELPCLLEEAAGVKCYNEPLEVTGDFIKARNARKEYRIFMKVQVFKYGKLIELSNLDSSSFTFTADSVQLELSRVNVKVKRKENAANIRLKAKKPEGFKPAKGHCVTVGMVDPVKKQTHEFVHCFS